MQVAQKVPTAKIGDKLTSGDILGTVQETAAVLHKILVPNKIEGELVKINEGEFTIDEAVAVIKTDDGDKEIKMFTTWPVRVGRPYKKKLSPDTFVVGNPTPTSSACDGPLIAAILAFGISSL